MTATTMRDPKLVAMRNRIKERMAEKGLNIAETQRRAGFSDSSTWLYQFLNGTNSNPGTRNLQRIATALDSTIAQLQGDNSRSDDQKAKIVAASEIPVIGVAEAGAFRQMHWDPDAQEIDLPTIHAPRSRRYPSARHFAFLVSGTSMNAAGEGREPILDGEYALCVDVVDAGLMVESGKIYTVRRTLDGGQTYEVTLKRAFVFRDRVELVPESTDPRHQKIVVSRQHLDDGKEVMVIGLLYGVQRSYE